MAADKSNPIIYYDRIEAKIVPVDDVNEEQEFAISIEDSIFNENVFDFYERERFIKMLSFTELLVFIFRSAGYSSSDIIDVMGIKDGNCYHKTLENLRRKYDYINNYDKTL